MYVDYIKQFIEECCEVLTKEEFSNIEVKNKKYYRIATSELYSSFSEFAKINSCHSGLGKSKFFSYI